MKNEMIMFLVKRDLGRNLVTFCAKNNILHNFPMFCFPMDTSTKPLISLFSQVSCSTMSICTSFKTTWYSDVLPNLSFPHPVAIQSFKEMCEISSWLWWKKCSIFIIKLLCAGPGFRDSEMGVQFFKDLDQGELKPLLPELQTAWNKGGILQPVLS